MPGKIAERLTQARRRRFVGRSGELELFRAALDGEHQPLAVLHVYGPGGTGKTALLGAFADEAAAAGVTALRIDMREVDPVPPAFRGALAARLGCGPDDVERALADGRRRVLLIDTYEQAGALDLWLRDRFLPELPAETLVVIAGRDVPGSAWLTDPGWKELARVISLRNLAPQQTEEYLRAAGVPAELHDRALELTHGHPLALSLFVEVLAQRSSAGVPPLPGELWHSPDVVQPLHHLFLEGVPSERHRRALEATAHVRSMTEDLLREALQDPAGVADLFEWLRGLSFVEQAPYGLFLHDLVRDVLDADLRWRDPAGYGLLRRRIRPRLVERIRSCEGQERRRAIADLVYMHRSNPLTSSFFAWDSFGGAYGDVLRPDDADAILAMTRRYEGEESAALVAHWLQRQPHRFHVVRSAEGEPIGFVLLLALHETTPEDRELDPGARSMWEYAQRHGAPRPGDEVYAGRTMIDAAAYQSPSLTTSVAAIASMQAWFGASRLTWDFIGPWRDPEAVAPMMGYMEYQRVPEADYEIGGHRYGVFAHDFRRRNLEEWLELAHGRELDPGFDPQRRPEAQATALALSQADFAGAVRRALRDLHRDDALAANPLLRSRVVRERAGERPDPAALRDLLGEAIDALRADPRDEKLQRALARTFVRPAPTQEAAAEALGLPFSTYRRHLRRGVERVTEWLWQHELYGALEH